MRRASPWIALAVVVAAAAAAVAAYLLIPQEPPPSPPVRPAPAIPSPSPEEKIRYFYRLLGSGETVTVAAPLVGASPLEFPVWRDVARSALLSFGDPALAFLTSEERYPEYVSSPDILVAVLQLLLLARVPERFPFLAHWLDEGNCPPPAPGADWPDEIRNLVFRVLKKEPEPEAARFCEAELRRPQRGHDYRPAAADILLRLGKADILNELFEGLPPTPEAPEPDLRSEILARLFEMAAPAAGDRNHAQVNALEPLLERTLLSPRAIERVHAMAVLHRLGRPGMREQIERFFRENREKDENAAFGALLLLGADGPVPFVHDACKERIAHPDAGVGFTTAVRILSMHWMDENAPLFLEWIRARKHIDPYLVLPRLLRHDRAAVVDWLRGELRSGGDLLRTLAFLSGEGVTELAPDVVDMVRDADPERRTPLYRALVLLRAPGTEALLLAELNASIPDNLRSAAAAEILNLAGQEGIARLADLVGQGDAAALDAVLQRAWQSQGAGVPDGLLPGLLEAVRRIPGEDGRRAALLVLRFRGKLDGVRDGLVEAYRHEPSRRVAKEIEETIVELAHR
ncbi:MAG TPA: hypothetical protein VFY93_07370 [Planctomycetota bacterium]|nr:hypothetical protein [Planctomycetota bacterium]